MELGYTVTVIYTTVGPWQVGMRMRQYDPFLYCLFPIKSSMQACPVESLCYQISSPDVRTGGTDPCHDQK